MKKIVEMYSKDGLNMFLENIVTDRMKKEFGDEYKNFLFKSVDDTVGFQIVNESKKFSALFLPEFDVKPNIMRVRLDDVIMKTYAFMDIMIDYYMKLKEVRFGLDENRFGKWEFTVKDGDDLMSFVIPFKGENNFVFRLKLKNPKEKRLVSAFKTFIDSPLGEYYLVSNLGKFSLTNPKLLNNIDVFRQKLLMLINNSIDSFNNGKLQMEFIGLTVRYSPSMNRFVITNGYPGVISGFGKLEKNGKSYSAVFM